MLSFFFSSEHVMGNYGGFNRFIFNSLLVKMFVIPLRGFGGFFISIEVP